MINKILEALKPKEEITIEKESELMDPMVLPKPEYPYCN